MRIDEGRSEKPIYLALAESELRLFAVRGYEIDQP